MNKIEVAAIKPTIPFAVLDQVDIRVGMIQSVEDVPGSRKLVKLTVDFGDHQRTIFAGLKPDRANPQEIEGKQALFFKSATPKISSVLLKLAQARCLCHNLDLKWKCYI